MDKDEFFNKCFRALGGDFFAQVNASILADYYDAWQNSSLLIVEDKFFEAFNTAIRSCSTRSKFPYKEKPVLEEKPIQD